ncbi:hypothetical protein CVIRNUC_002602 [Coccomyxa viridis]|uniref:Protein kinase domain-containing protein n=1 Tax=Coccomyxa viridis TaxID=1274662 RepID=A0AAV1HZ97_9CHLO|nr:hypothetical protein CVIRNUC_002602 [Coccomyxa viridis]
MDALYQHRGCLISLRSFKAVPHLKSKPCHASSVRHRGCCRRNIAVQAAYTAQLAATDLDPYTDVEYNAQRNAVFWETRPVLVLRRTAEIVVAFARWYLWIRLTRGTSIDSVSELQAERLREILTQLGPAFVKIGQAVSSRPDVAPPSYTRELEKLQDQIPPFPNADAMAVIEEDTRQPIMSTFSYISPEPIAAASLGQVYRARLREGGREVAVKVQRPGVKESIALDIYILRSLAVVIRRVRRINSDLGEILDEWAESLFRELDYRREARNGIRFRELYGDLEGIYAPEMLLERTTPRVLIMEWVEGQRLRRAGRNGEGPSREELQADLKLVEIGVQCSLEQILERGFHHADPHPGNLLRMSGDRLAYIDFGMMGDIQTGVRRGLIRATLHMVNREFDALADDFVELGLLPTGANRYEVVPALTRVFSNALAGGVSNVSFSDLSADLGRTMYEFKFRIPPYYTLLVRTLSVLEGIALSADPNYKVLGSAYPWIAQRLLSDKSPELQETLRALLYKGSKFQFGRLESLLRQAVKAPPRAATIAGSGKRAASPGARALELLLGAESGYVRDILAEELAKGLDAYWRLSADDALDAARARLVAVLGVQGRPEHAVSGRAAPGSPNNALLQGLLQVPDLATTEDREQSAGIVSLSALLQELASTTDAGVAMPSPVPEFLRPFVPAQAAEALSLLQWLGAELQALPQGQRAEALRLPLLLGGKLTSRVAARALRALLLPPQSAAAASPSAPSSISQDEPVAPERSPVSRVQSPSPETVTIRQAATTTPAGGSEDMFSAPDLAAPSATIPAPPLPSAAQIDRRPSAPSTAGLRPSGVQPARPPPVSKSAKPAAAPDARYPGQSKQNGVKPVPVGISGNGKVRV